MNKRHAKRLLNVAHALRESPVPENFTMFFYGKSCGTPACAFGHYAFRTDLQRKFRLKFSLSEPVYVVDNDDGFIVHYDSNQVGAHFGIRAHEAEELFGFGGCGGALTPKEAARYIERFVKSRVTEEQWFRLQC